MNLKTISDIGDTTATDADGCGVAVADSAADDAEGSVVADADAARGESHDGEFNAH